MRMHYPLREQLHLLPGPSAVDGSPQWTIQDPSRNVYFTVDWVTFEFLSRWTLGTPADIVEAVNRDTTLHVELRDYEHVFSFLLENELLALPAHATFESCVAKTAQKKQGLFLWLIHNYLFFRVPLFRTDRWLTRTLRHVRVFYSAAFLRLTAAAGILGLYGVYSEWDSFAATFLDLISLQGFCAYAAALVAAKLAHELGHAYTAKRYGCRVPSMGLAFLVMMPFPYTDTNDVWKLTDKKARLHVDLAGVATELVVAAWSLLVWVFMPPGTVRTLAYVLATTTWINTLAINASPFMRFDGYYALADYLGVANLHAKASALASWRLREILFRLRDPAPEELPRQLRTFVILFAWVTWIYRLAIFLSIAVLVYHFFIKAVGILLFLVEIVWFVLLPIFHELKLWHERRRDILTPATRARVWALAALGCALLVIPWDLRIREPGMLRPADRYYVFAPESAQVISPPLSHGSPVKKGEPLLALHSPELSRRVALAETDLRELQWRVGAAAFDKDLRQALQSNGSLADAATHEIQSLYALRDMLHPVAPWDGEYYEVEPDVRPGDWLSKGTKLGMVVKPGAWIVESYFPEEDLPRLRLGSLATFFPETAGSAAIALEVSSIDPTPIKVLEDAIYGTEAGGGVQVRMVSNKMVTDRPYYRVTFKVTERNLHSRIVRGRVIVLSRPESLLSMGVRHAGGVLQRELTF
jgi:putative peptide zinc metalloprotease protein